MSSYLDLVPVLEAAMHAVTDNHKPRIVKADRAHRRLRRPEREVLKALAESSRPLSALQLHMATGLTVDDIRRAVEVLHERSFITRLNTVIDSWVCRAPLCVLPGGSAGHPGPPLVA
jgi:hypothetical protein